MTKRTSEDFDTPYTKKTKVEIENPRKSVTFLILSDTHELELSAAGPFRLGVPEEKIDVVLHCGDLTEDGSNEGFKKGLDMLSEIDAELKLLIVGNHEISLDREYSNQEWGSDEMHQEAVNLLRGLYTEAAGVLYLEEGMHSFTLANGAIFTVYTSPFTPREDRFSTSGFQYLSSEDRFNPSASSRPEWARCIATESSAIPLAVDIVMTHGPPKYILDQTNDKRSIGCSHLWRAIVASKPLLHCFGHVHASWGHQRVAWRSGYGPKELEMLELSGDGMDKDESIRIRDFVSRGKANRDGAIKLPDNVYAELQHGRQTLFVNAAIDPDENHRARNAPWVVDLTLPIENKA
jgi:hypothetical protein